MKCNPPSHIGMTSAFLCHCEARSAEAISGVGYTNYNAIASLLLRFAQGFGSQ